METFILGLATSIIAWFITNRFCAPRIAISKKIVHMRSGKYVFKIQNQSHWHEIYDVSIYIRYCFSSNNYYPYIQTPVALLKVKPRKTRTTFAGEPYEMKIEIKGPKKRGQEQEIPLHDFFSIPDQPVIREPYIDVIIICYDKFSGSTRHAIQERYHRSDVCENSYFPDGFLEAVPYPEEDSGIQN